MDEAVSSLITQLSGTGQPADMVTRSQGVETVLEEVHNGVLESVQESLAGNGPAVGRGPSGSGPATIGVAPGMVGGVAEATAIAKTIVQKANAKPAVAKPQRQGIQSLGNLGRVASATPKQFQLSDLWWQDRQPKKQ